MRRRALQLLWGSVIVFSALTLLLPLLREPGLARGTDVPLHLGNVVECAHLLKAGKLPPYDWLPDIAGGRGGPNYIYYGSLGFLGPACLVNLGLEPEDAMRVWTGLVIVLGFVSAALFGSLFGGWLGGLLCGALFVYGPYFYTLPFSRGAYPEHLAYSLYPLVFYFAARARSEKGWVPVVGSAVALFAIVAAHTLSLAIIVPALVVYLMLGGKLGGGATGYRALLGKCGAVLIFSAVLLAPCLVGPLLGRQQVVLSEQLTSSDTALLYADIGVPWHSIFTRDFLDDIVSRCVPGRVHLFAVLAAALIAVGASDPSTRREVAFHLALALGALLLAERTIAALCVKALPAVAYIQFPWRFLSLFNLFACAACSACASKASPLPQGWKVALAVGLPVWCVLLYFGHIQPQEVRGLRTRNRAAIRASLTTLDHENKYMPVGAKLPERQAPKVLLEVPDGECFEVDLRPNDYRYRVQATSSQRAKFHHYFFDGWRAEVDGKPHPLLKDKNGLCEIELPEGVHEVRLGFVRTPLHAGALAISAAGWTALLLAASIAAARRIGLLGRGPSPEPPAAPETEP